MQAPDLAIRELERCMKIGLAGVQIGSHVNDWNLDAPELFEVFAAAEELGACVFVHPWDMMAQQKMPKYWLPWLVGMPAESTLALCSLIFGGVLERLPKLRVAVAHGGGSLCQHHWPHRARLAGAPRPLRRRQPPQPAQVPGQVLGRFAGARPADAGLPGENPGRR